MRNTRWRSGMKRVAVAVYGAGLCALLVASVAHGSFHTWRIAELYTDASGSVQFVELHEAFDSNFQDFFAGRALTSSQGTTTRTFTFPANLPNSSTANKRLLVGTQGFANLNVVTPDFIVPGPFLFPGGGTLDFAGVDFVTYPALPTDGVNSLDRGGTIDTNSPTNYAGSDYSRNYVQKAYVAYYGRPADPGGQRYWAARMDAEGQSLNALIAAFGHSDEFNRRYGALSYVALVTRIYQQALGRDPEQSGLDYYVGELQAGRRTLQSITLDVLNGATTPPDATVVANRLHLAAYYTANVVVGCLYGTEQDGVNSLSGVTADLVTVAIAKVAITSRCGP